MRISTRQFGLIDIDESKIITMQPEMPGFPGKKRFALIEHEGLKPFHYFQSVDDPMLGFIIMDPYTFKPDYQVDYQDKAGAFGWEDDNLFIYVIINAAGNDPKSITANLIGPLLINTDKNEAAQLVINNINYSHKYKIFKDNNLK